MALKGLEYMIGFVVDKWVKSKINKSDYESYIMKKE